MSKIILFTLIFLNSFLIKAQDLDKIDIENHPLDSFPQITLSTGEGKIAFYGMDSSLESDLMFIKESKLSLASEVPLSGYIFSKEFVESFRIPKTIANKKTNDEFVRIFAEKDPAKLVEFLMHVNEKKRTAQNDQELAMISKIIKSKKTDDDPSSTPFFSTGYVEIQSPKNNNERYFIKAADINKKNIKLNANKTRISLLKAITVYSFQNILSGLNEGGFEAGSPEEILSENLKKLNSSICGISCPLDFTVDLSQLALSVGKIVSFEVVGHSKIKNIDDFEKYVMAQQWCVLKNFANACHVKELDTEIENLANNKIIKDLISRHQNSGALCKFLQK